MLYELKNRFLTVLVNDFGAEVMSVVGAQDGCEYLWQGDEAYWKGRSPNLFPICGRLYRSCYTYGGKTYEMSIHGFAKRMLFTVEEATQERLTLTLCDNAETRAEFPFSFRLTVTYTLDGQRLRAQIRIANTGTVILPATFGAHPGFNVPLTTGKRFEDYSLVFGEECSPDRLLFSDALLNTGKREAFPLEDGNKLRLNHSLFDQDAIFLCRTADRVTLCADGEERKVTVEYPDFPYLGIWHKPQSDAPYVCIEPWCGMAAYDREVAELSTRSDMFRIRPGTDKTIAYSMLFE